MITLAVSRFIATKLKCLALTALFVPAMGWAGAEETFDVLQIGSQTYQNVTITTKAKDYIFIMHSTGMSNIKVAELSPEQKAKLGYKRKSASASSNAVSNWAKQTLAKVDMPQLTQFGASLTGQAPSGSKLSLTQLLPVLGIVLVLHFLFSYCCMLICQKTGNDPGMLVWIPIVQLFPMLRAAGMSRGWFIAFLVPLINIIGFIVWASNISQARGKSGWVALFLILPFTNPLALMYLAFSKGTPARDDRRIEVMALELA
jgi:hypothetical protein